MSESDYLLLFKSIHIAGFVAWFAGLFYLVRIFVYHREALDDNPVRKQVLVPQYQLMENKAYRIICNPAMMITWTFGLLMLWIYGTEWLKTNSWMHIKLMLVILLTVYHIYCKKLIIKLASEQVSLNSFQLRLINEVATLLLLAIVLIAVYRNLLNFGWALVGLLVVALFIYFGVRFYRKARQEAS